MLFSNCIWVCIKIQIVENKYVSDFFIHVRVVVVVAAQKFSQFLETLHEPRDLQQIKSTLLCQIWFNCSIDLPSDTGTDGLTTEHGGGVDQTMDPGSGGIIPLKVQLELHKKHGNTSGYRDRGSWI